MPNFAVKCNLKSLIKEIISRIPHDIYIHTYIYIYIYIYIYKERKRKRTNIISFIYKIYMCDG